MDGKYEKMKNKIKIGSLLLIVFLSLSLLPKSGFSSDEYNVEPYWNICKLADGESAYAFDEELSSDAFEGRQSGMPGCEMASQWIADEFRDMGLKPYNEKESSYLQPLEVPYYDIMEPLTFQYRENNNLVKPVYRKDFVVFPYSGSGKAESKMVFVGYGITTNDKSYDDYESISVANKIVVMFYGKPFFLSEYNDEYGSLEKISNAKEHNASAVIFIDKSTATTFMPFGMKWASGRDAELPALYLSKEMSEKIIIYKNHTLKEVEETIDNEHKPYSFSLEKDAQIEVNVEFSQKRSHNVIGYIPAINTETEESIVIGGHFDHLGKDNIVKTIYRGANDNGSGTSCMMEVAKTIAKSFSLPTVNIVFIAFTGEEEGLVGSDFYTRHPLFPIKNIKAMINLDMVGTGTGNLLAGTSRSKYPDLCDLITACTDFMEIDVPIDPSLLYPGSDHYFFHIKGVPSVFFFKENPTNIGGYHTLEDTMDSIDPENLEICSQLVCLMALTLSEPAFIDFDSFPKETQLKDPFISWKGLGYRIEENDLSIYIKESPLKIYSDGEIDLFYPLSLGNNEIVLEVRYQNQVIKQKKINIISTADPRLRADFDQDLDIDLSDLILLARNFGKKANLYQALSMFDLNQDQIVNDDDFVVFKEFFGYAISQRP